MTSRVITTGYGRDALDALRAVVAEAKQDDPMSPVTVLVPDNIAGIVARRHLAHGLHDPSGGDGSGGSGAYGPGVAGLLVTTLPRLAEQLAAPSLHPRRPATHPVVASAWRRALDEAPGCFDQVREHPSTIRALGAAHHELRDVSPEGRDRARSATGLSPDLLRLHEDVVERLRSDWYDTTDLLHAAADLVGDRPALTREHGLVVLYLPQALSQAECRFARSLTAQRGLTVIVGMTGVRRADAAVRRTLDRLGLAQPEATGRPPVATRVMHASDSDDEVRCVVREVVATLEDTPAHRVAVLYGSAAPYARLLHEHLGAAGVTVNGPSTRAVHERAIARGFLGVLELAEPDLPRAATFLALAEAPVRDLHGERVPVARWERVSRLAGVVHGSDWAPRLAAYAARERRVIAAEEDSEDPRPGRLEAARREIDTADQLADFVATLRAVLQQGRERETWSDLSDWALDLFHALYGDPGSLTRLPAEEQYAAVVVESALRGLRTLDAFEPAADLATLVEVLALELESALPRVGRFGEGVFVGPVSAAVGLDLDRTFVVGLAEDSYPGRLREDALLNDRVREATGGELPAGRERLDSRHRQLLAALASAPEVTAAFPRGDLRRSTERLPSRWLLPSLRAISGNRNLAATDWQEAVSERLVASESFAHTLTSTPLPASEQEWRVRAASARQALHDEVVDAAHALLTGRAGAAFTRYDGNLGGVPAEMPLPDHAHEDRPVSPTSLETYATCPHRYFVQKLLRVEPVEQPEEVITISALEIGNLIHESMDALISECQEDGTLPSYSQPWTAAQRQRLQQIATDMASEFADRGVTGHPLLWEPERERILRELERMLDEDDRWRAERDARVVSSELEFGRNGATPVVIDLDDGRVQMLGSADKIDETRDGVLVVTDIKSGRKDKFRPIDDDPVVAGTKLQLPVYAHAARQLLGGDEVEAMYWFVLRTPGRIQVRLDADLEKTYAETVGTLVGSIAAGLFPAKPSDKPSYGYVDCAYCDPDGMGHGDLRGRYERKRLDPALRRLVGLIDPDALADDTEAGEHS